MQRKIRLIDADDTIIELIRLDDEQPWSDAQRGMILTLISTINAMPKKEYDPPRERGAGRRCAASKASTSVQLANLPRSRKKSRYCPDCGAKMEEA